ncbi:MAG: glycosyltransferase family protein [Synergistaceae bacterium]|jgi:spore coat polysaccharide biosynthesis protein SpsF|nr:glycosyltransferase family protein [Synergistaceae bacterium]
MKTIAIIQARMASSRLPGKILKDIHGKPMLQYELERLRKIPSLDEIVVATTRSAADDAVADFCGRFGALAYRGSEHDVLSRYYEAARLYGADVVVRFTADCPLVDPCLSERVIRHYLDEAGSFDYCSVDVKETTRPYPRGMDTEVFSMKALAEAHAEGVSQAEREHVTYFIYNRPARYRIWFATADRDLSNYRLTVDAPEDFELVGEIINYFARAKPAKPNFALKDIIALLDGNPKLANLNKSVRQKELKKS